MKSIVVMPLLFIVMTSCTLSFPQATSSANWIKALFADRTSTDESDPQVWFASFRGHGAVLKPYASEGLIVFANEDGDAISFDGWIIRSITGFNSTAVASIQGREGARIIIYDEDVFKMTCGPWVLESQLWTQSCSSGQAKIGLDNGGNIQFIEIPLGKELGFVKLQVAKI